VEILRSIFSLLLVVGRGFAEFQVYLGTARNRPCFSYSRRSVVFVILGVYLDGLGKMLLTLEKVSLFLLTVGLIRLYSSDSDSKDCRCDTAKW
jgi:hypothetical protein